MSNELTTTETTELEQNEAIIERGLKTFVEVGGALLAIRDGKLYRQEWGTFEDYCRERWQMTDRYARNLMTAAEVVSNLKTGTTVPVLPDSERQARPLTSLAPEDQPIVWNMAVETAPNGKVTAAHVAAVVKEYKAPAIDNTYEVLADDLAGDESGYDWTTEAIESARQIESNPSSMAIHYSSDTPEHYTPRCIIDLVLDLMGGIDLDPCSNSKTKPNVPAAVHYTQKEDGLAQKWDGSVYLNPPYGREIGAWVEKLRQEFDSGNVTEAVALVPARVDTAWWNTLTSTDGAYPLVCFVKGRLTFIGNEDPAPFPSAVVYLGDNRVEFYSVFSSIGRIWSTWNEEIAGITDYGSK